MERAEERPGVTRHELMLSCTDGSTKSVRAGPLASVPHPQARLGEHRFPARQGDRRKTNDVAGDMTTATVLAQAMVKQGLRNVATGASPMALKRGIEAAVDAAVESTAIQAKDVDDKVDIEHVASVSAADHAIGGQITEAMDNVGKH
jgi:hypothetical protein